MPVTLSDVLSRVRSNIDEPTADQWSDTELTNWINDGCRDVARRSEDLLQFDTSLAIMAGQYIYTLPTVMTRINRAEFVPTGSTQTYPVVPSTQAEMDQIWGVNQQSQSSYPSYIVTLGFPGGAGNALFRCQLYPVPAQAGTLNLYYYGLPYRFLDPIANPSELAKNVTLPEGWDDLVVLYCEAEAKRKDRDPDWKDAMQLYESKMQNLIDVSRFFHDQAQSVLTSSRLNVPQWLYDSEW